MRESEALILERRAEAQLENAETGGDLEAMARARRLLGDVQRWAVGERAVDPDALEEFLLTHVPGLHEADRDLAEGRTRDSADVFAEIVHEDP